MSSRSPLLEARAREAALTKHHGADHPEVLKAKAERRRLSAEKYIAELVASIPPLTPAERVHLMQLLTVEAADPTDAAA
jgi:hypothetical protein